MLIDTALYLSSLPSKISSHSDAFSRVTLVATICGEKKDCHFLTFRSWVITIRFFLFLFFLVCNSKDLPNFKQSIERNVHLNNIFPSVRCKIDAIRL